MQAVLHDTCRPLVIVECLSLFLIDMIVMKCPYLASVLPLACWDCGFESRRGQGCLSLVNVVCYQMSLRRAYHSSRGVLPSVVCLSVIVKTR